MNRIRFIRVDGTFSEFPNEAEGMNEPVRCRCGRVYDLWDVEVTARYTDCSVWKAPCCGRVSDSRESKSLPDYERLKR